MAFTGTPSISSESPSPKLKLSVLPATVETSRPPSDLRRSSGSMRWEIIYKRTVVNNKWEQISEKNKQLGHCH